MIGWIGGVGRRGVPSRKLSRGSKDFSSFRLRLDLLLAISNAPRMQPSLTTTDEALLELNSVNHSKDRVDNLRWEKYNKVSDVDPQLLNGL
jgi:hypothetical protein